jgi:hypothetical protein
MDRAMNRSGTWGVLNTTPNVTCLTPNIAAFNAAGSPDGNLNQADLTQVLRFHTLRMPLYTNFITDGMEMASLSNLTVRATVNSS